MFKLKAYKNQKINTETLVQILFYVFPITFIIGNLIVSVHSIIFTCIALFLITKKKLTLRFDISKWILIIFFLYLFLLTIVQFKYPGILWSKFLPEFEKLFNQNFYIESWYDVNGNPTLKAFLFLRFLLLVFVIDTLFYNKILNIKKFFLSCFVCTTFTSLDILLQYFAGKDIFGFSKAWEHNSGPFNDEHIAGTYLKNFSLFSFFYAYQNIKSKNNYMLVIIIVLHLVATLLSGNRMPMILLLFGCFLIFLFLKNFRLVMFLSIIFFISIFLVLASNDNYIKNPYYKFIINLNILKVIEIDKNKKNEEKKLSEQKNIDGSSQNIVLLRNSGHNRVWKTAIVIWKENLLTGSGLKSFRLKCVLIIKRKVDEIKDVACGNHPHNYYLEILSEVGLIGLFLILYFFAIILKNSVKRLKELHRQTDKKFFLLFPATIIFIIEIWPLKSTGSFFTTWNATFFWLNIGILYSFINYKKKNN